MSKKLRSPTGRITTSRPQLQNISPQLLPHQKQALRKIKKSLMEGPLTVSVNSGQSVVTLSNLIA